MPRQTGRSELASKIGSEGRQAIEDHRGDETVLDSGGDLPAGIEGGIARLTKCYFKEYETGVDKGEYFFRAEGCVVRPIDHDGQRTEGGTTSIQEPVCDTPRLKRKTKKEHIKEVMNHMRRLGADTSDTLNADDLEDVAAALADVKPHFRFRTWKGQKQTTGTYAGREPRTNHVWGEACEYNDDDTEEMVDSTEEVQEETQEPEDPETQSADWDELGALADPPNNDEEAIEALTAEAETLGIDHGSLPTWTEVAGEITSVQSGGIIETQPEEPEEFVPTKGLCYWIKAPRARKFEEFELTALFDGTRTCNLKRLADKRIFKSVAWDDLRLEEP